MKLLKNKYKTIIILLVIWFVATAFNITKAVHIDDTYYLGIAKHILVDPLHPLSGMLSWDETIKPIYRTFNPVLTSYIFAATVATFGESEVALHLVYSLFTFFAILFFYLLVKETVGRLSYLLTAMFALSPSFIPSQNLMSDIPVLSLWLAFFWLIISSLNKKNSLINPASIHRYGVKLIFSGIVIGLAILVKYSSLILIPVLFMAVILEKNWRYLLVVVIPLVFLFGWSVFNYLDYGGIHILSSNKFFFGIYELVKKLGFWLITLGAVSPFSIVVIPYILARKRRFLWLLSCLVATHIISVSMWRSFSEPAIFYFLRQAFFCNGLFIFGLALYILIKKLLGKAEGATLVKKKQSLIFAVWFVGTSVYLIVFVPFMAVRHVLLIIPVLLLIFGSYLAQTIPRRWFIAGLVGTISLAFILGLSDWKYANLYRVEAKNISRKLRSIQEKSERSGKLWFSGHWGWQWYVSREGLSQYDYFLTEFQDGDLLVAPKIYSQWVSNKHWGQLVKIESIVIPGDKFTLFRLITSWPGDLPRGYYATASFDILPWVISTEPLEEFTIYEVKKDSAL